MQVARLLVGIALVLLALLAVWVTVQTPPVGQPTVLPASPPDLLDEKDPSLAPAPPALSTARESAPPIEALPVPAPASPGLGDDRAPAKAVSVEGRVRVNAVDNT